MTRVNVDISETAHQKLKMESAFSGQTLEETVEELILENIDHNVE
jgi:hypothetical protein